MIRSDGNKTKYTFFSHRLKIMCKKGYKIWSRISQLLIVCRNATWVIPRFSLMSENDVNCYRKCVWYILILVCHGSPACIRVFAVFCFLFGQFTHLLMFLFSSTAVCDPPCAEGSVCTEPDICKPKF